MYIGKYTIHGWYENSLIEVSGKDFLEDSIWNKTTYHYMGGLTCVKSSSFGCKCTYGIMASWHPFVFDSQGLNPRMLQHTPKSHTPGNPPAMPTMKGIPNHSPSVKVARGVFHFGVLFHNLRLNFEARKSHTSLVHNFHGSTLAGINLTAQGTPGTSSNSARKTPSSAESTMR